MNKSEFIMETMFKFNASVYSKIDLINYNKRFTDKSLNLDKQQIRMDKYNSEQEMIFDAKKILKADFHDDSYFSSMLIVKRMLFLNLFKKNKNAIIEENSTVNSKNFKLKEYKAVQYRTLLFVIKSLMIFFTKKKEISGILDSLKVFFSYDIIEKEIKIIFKNLNRFFEIDSNYLKSIFFIF